MFEHSQSVSGFTESLARYNVKVLIDYSGSTSWPLDRNNERGRTRHHAMAEATIGVVSDVLPLDADGVDIYAFNGNGVTRRLNVTSVEDATAFLTNSVKVGGGTPLYEALACAFHDTDGLPSERPALYIVLFDGRPDWNTEGKIEKLITDRANHQAARSKELIIFVQFGDDHEAAAWLKSLDTGLKDAIEDIVFTVSHEDYGKFHNFQAMVAAGMVDNRA